MSDARTIRAGGAYVEITAKTDKLKKKQREIEMSFSQMGQNITQKIFQVGDFADSVGMIYNAALKGVVDFDTQMRYLQATIRADNNEMLKLTKTAKELSGWFSAKEIGSMMTILGRAGFTAKSLPYVTPAVSKMAAVGQVNPELAAEMASNVLRQFQLKEKDFASVADKLTYAANASNMSVQDLAYALSYVGTVAHQAGQGLDDTLGQLMTLANVGIKGSMAGTSLANMFKRSAAPTTLNALMPNAESSDYLKQQKENMAILAKAGIQITDSNNNFRPMMEILKDMNKAFKDSGAGNAEILSAITKLFQSRGAMGAMALLTNTKATSRNVADLVNAPGYLDEAQNALNQGFEGRMRTAINAFFKAWHAQITSEGGNLEPVYNSMVSMMTSITSHTESIAGFLSQILKFLPTLLAIKGAAYYGQNAEKIHQRVAKAIQPLTAMRKYGKIAGNREAYNQELKAYQSRYRELSASRDILTQQREELEQGMVKLNESIKGAEKSFAKMEKEFTRAKRGDVSDKIATVQSELGAEKLTKRKRTALEKKLTKLQEKQLKIDTIGNAVDLQRKDIDASKRLYETKHKMSDTLTKAIDATEKDMEKLKKPDSMMSLGDLRAMKRIGQKARYAATGAAGYGLGAVGASLVTDNAFLQQTAGITLGTVMPDIVEMLLKQVEKSARGAAVLKAASTFGIKTFEFLLNPATLKVLGGAALLAAVAGGTYYLAKDKVLDYLEGDSEERANRERVRQEKKQKQWDNTVANRAEWVLKTKRKNNEDTGDHWLLNNMMEQANGAMEIFEQQKKAFDDANLMEKISMEASLFATISKMQNAVDKVRHMKDYDMKEKRKFLGWQDELRFKDEDIENAFDFVIRTIEKWEDAVAQGTRRQEEMNAAVLEAKKAMTDFTRSAAEAFDTQHLNSYAAKAFEIGDYMRQEVEAGRIHEKSHEYEEALATQRKYAVASMSEDREWLNNLRKVKPKLESLQDLKFYVGEYNKMTEKFKDNIVMGSLVSDVGSELYDKQRADQIAVEQDQLKRDLPEYMDAIREFASGISIETTVDTFGSFNARELQHQLMSFNNQGQEQQKIQYMRDIITYVKGLPRELSDRIDFSWGN